METKTGAGASVAPSLRACPGVAATCFWTRVNSGLQDLGKRGGRPLCAAFQAGARKYGEGRRPQGF
eukprot:10417522-Alexandrium_andersonii.AAC.1